MEDSALHVHCYSLPGDRTLGQHNSFTQKILLKRVFDGNIWETVQIHYSGLLEDRASS